MPIGLKKYINLKEKKPKTNKELLEFMDQKTDGGESQAFTTTDIEKFLEIQHPAALSRLKRLDKLGYIEKKVIGKHHYWRMIKLWPEESKPIQVVDAMSPTGITETDEILDVGNNNG